MRTFQLTIFVVFALLATCQAQQPAEVRKLDPARERMRVLIERLPTQNELAECERIIKEGAPTWKKQEIRDARRKLRLAQREIPRLFKRIKAGTSVFDYPGLLRLGKIDSGMSSAERDGPEAFRYWMTVGGPPLVSTDDVAAEFIVAFDAAGIILEVNDLVCRF